MAKAVTQTLENQRVIIWTSLRCGVGARKKISIVVNDCKIEYLERGAGWLNWARLSFVDPFSLKTVSIRRQVGSGFQLLDLNMANYGIRGFEGFTDRPKRPRKEKPKKKKLLPAGANQVTGIIAGAGLDNAQWGAPTGGLAMTESYYAPKNMLAHRNFELADIDPPLPIRTKLVAAKERIIREDKDNFMKTYKYDYKAPVSLENYWTTEDIVGTTTINKITDSIVSATKQYTGANLVGDIKVEQASDDPGRINVTATVLEPRPLNKVDFTFTAEQGIVEH